MGVKNVKEFAYIDRPDDAAIDSALVMLPLLGALDDKVRRLLFSVV